LAESVSFAATGNTLEPPLASKSPESVGLFTQGVEQGSQGSLPQDMHNVSQSSVEKDHINIVNDLWDNSSLREGAGSLFYSTSSPAKYLVRAVPADNSDGRYLEFIHLP
jgi:hypothetical protein